MINTGKFGDYNSLYAIPKQKEIAKQSRQAK